MKNKKILYTILGIIAFILVTIGLTYAYWLVTKTQSKRNLVTTKCLDISLSNEENNITLTNQFPMSDEDGMKLVPYEFTVTNNCNTSVDYQVALEAIGDSSNALKGTSLKVALNDSAKLYSAYPSVETTIEGAYESRVLGYSKLAAAGSEGSSDTYSLRIWIDEDAPISDMSKTFRSRISVTIGQGIESPYGEGTLAYDILAKAGGVYATSEIDPDECHHRITATGDTFLYTLGNYYYGTEYTFDKETGKYILSGRLTQATIAECRAGTKKCGKYTLMNASSTYSSTTLYEITDWNNSNGTNYVTANTSEYVNAFSKVTTADEAGLYKTQDDLGDSYYFRGAPSNNYVQFGSYAANSTVGDTTYNEETPMYWRIVRINGDGTIRLVYDGTTKAENGTEHASNVGNSAFNSNYDNAKYVGYTYEGTNEAGETVQVDSTIKGVLDTWYDIHLKANYGDKIADSIFCNDRSEASYKYYDESYSTITDPNAAVYTEIYYGAYQRLNTDKAPSLKCPNQSDRYTVSDTTNGNGLLKNPVGLITADEEVLAGNSAYNENTSYYLYNRDGYWTSAPSFWIGINGLARMLSVNLGNLTDLFVNSDNGVRPVINLKADVLFEGDGSYDTPYVIK